MGFKPQRKLKEWLGKIIMLVAGSSLALEIEYQTQTMKINTSRAGSI